MNMLYKFLKKIYNLFQRPSLWYTKFIWKFFNYIIPNIRFLLSKRVNYSSTLKCVQKTLLTGSGVINIGKNCTFGYKLGGFYRGGSIEIQARYSKSIIRIGNKVATNNNIFICAANYIEIGKNTRIGQNVTIMDFEAHGLLPSTRNRVGKIGKVVIGENVWIGNNVIILKNTNIGKNTIVAAGSVVTGNFPCNVVVGGVPAKIIKSL